MRTEPIACKPQTVARGQIATKNIVCGPRRSRPPGEIWRPFMPRQASNHLSNSQFKIAACFHVLFANGNSRHLDLIYRDGVIIMLTIWTLVPFKAVYACSIRSLISSTRLFRCKVISAIFGILMHALLAKWCLSLNASLNFHPNPTAKIGSIRLSSIAVRWLQIVQKVELSCKTLTTLQVIWTTS